MIVPKRPVTRLPHPFPSQVRYLLVGVLYRALSWFLAPFFRQAITLDDLASARILILKPCCLGDVVFATALLRELRRALPDAHLTFGVGAHSRPVVATQPALNDLLDTGRVGSGPYNLADLLALVREIRARHFDACLVLERSALLALVPLLAGIPKRVGIDSGGRGFSLGVAVSSRPARPESELYLDLLRALGGRPLSGHLEYVPSTDAVRRVDQLIRDRLPAGRPFVILHCAGGTNPGLSLLRKRWPIESFRELAARINRTGRTVVLVGAEEDRVAVSGRWDVPTDGLPVHPTDRRPSEAAIVDLVGQLSLDELAELARRAAAYVGNDSGPSHLAEAAGANVVMLFGPSDPIIYGPRHPRAIALTAGLWCSPCFENGRVAPCANVICLRALSVDRVWYEVARLIAASQDAPRQARIGQAS